MSDFSLFEIYRFYVLCDFNSEKSEINILLCCTPSAAGYLSGFFKVRPTDRCDTVFFLEKRNLLVEKVSVLYSCAYTYITAHPLTPDYVHMDNCIHLAIMLSIWTRIQGLFSRESF